MADHQGRRLIRLRRNIDILRASRASMRVGAAQEQILGSNLTSIFCVMLLKRDSRRSSPC